MQMYISNMLHFLDETGNIPKQMPNEARELASFFALVIDTTTNINPKRLSATLIRYIEKGCPGTTRFEILPSTEIHWMCSRCENEGRITQLEGTYWDTRKSK